VLCVAYFIKSEFCRICFNVNACLDMFFEIRFIMLQAIMKSSAECHLVFEADNLSLVHQSFISCRYFYTVS